MHRTSITMKITPLSQTYHNKQFQSNAAGGLEYAQKEVQLWHRHRHAGVVTSGMVSPVKDFRQQQACLLWQITNVYASNL